MRLHSLSIFFIATVNIGSTRLFKVNEIQGGSRLICNKTCMSALKLHENVLTDVSGITFPKLVFWA